MANYRAYLFSKKIETSEIRNSLKVGRLAESGDLFFYFVFRVWCFVFGGASPLASHIMRLAKTTHTLNTGQRRSTPKHETPYTKHENYRIRSCISFKNASCRLIISRFLRRASSVCGLGIVSIRCSHSRAFGKFSRCM